MAGQYGWCSTCKELRDEVDAGKQGYCDKYNSKTETKQEQAQLQIFRGLN